VDLSDSHLHWDDAQLSAAEILRRAHSLVEFGWCQGADATDAADQPVDPFSANACHWSLLGALVAALDTPERNPESPELIAALRLALVAISDLIPDWSLQHWNDHPARTQAGVIDTLARAQDRIGAPAHPEQP
jgi:hypothetical protein